MATRVEHQMQLQWKQCYVQSTGNKWKDMEVDCHLQTSIISGLVDNCYRSASNYFHYRLQKKEISRIIVCIAKSREERLDLKTLSHNNVSLAEKVGTYAIVCIVYGIETYWILLGDPPWRSKRTTRNPRLSSPLWWTSCRMP